MRVRNEEVVEESLHTAMRMRVPVVVVMPVVVFVVGMRMLVLVLVLALVLVLVLVLVCVAHDCSTACTWWWRGMSPSECSAWKIASDTSCLACSFSSR
ncbi:hypothetical protein GCM10027415_31970 [Humibacter ginsengisoli]